MLIRVWDCETTGFPPDAAMCEIGWCDIEIRLDGAMTIGTPQGMLVNPGRPMPIEARAVHHIGDADLADAPPIEFGLRCLIDGRPDVFVAHNAAFERQFFTGGDGAQWICTYKVGLRLWPDAPSHTNQVLRYYLGLRLQDHLAMPPHRAAPDAYVTAHILLEALQLASIEDMIAWTEQPAMMVKIRFGKHRGRRWDEVPTDYLQWVAGQRDMDADTRACARHHLNLRGAR